MHLNQIKLKDYNAAISCSYWRCLFVSSCSYNFLHELSQFARCPGVHEMLLKRNERPLSQSELNSFYEFQREFEGQIEANFITYNRKTLSQIRWFSQLDHMSHFVLSVGGTLSYLSGLNPWSQIIEIQDFGHRFKIWIWYLITELFGTLNILRRALIPIWNQQSDATNNMFRRFEREALLHCVWCALFLSNFAVPSLQLDILSAAQCLISKSII